MGLISAHCSVCGKTFYRERRRISETEKFGWNTYCSTSCRYKSAHLLLKCSRPRCKITFERLRSEVNDITKTYCSRSCAIQVNNVNRLHPKKLLVFKKCRYCKKDSLKSGAFCSKVCQNNASLITKEAIIDNIKLFFQQNKRIPLKREFHHPHAARERFGTWNKAIIAAGLTPNKLKFTKHYKAKDSHICDSFTEMIIDNWLLDHDIKHSKNIPYGNTMTADFKINDTFIEYIGLKGVKAYDKHLANKEKFWKEKNINVIKLYPKDMYPNNRLDIILAKFM